VGARLQFGILGPLEVRRDGAMVGVGGRRQRALLALLLCNANRVVSRDRVIDGLLADQPADSADRALRVRISRLRKALLVTGDEPRLVSRTPGYLLRVGAGELDLHTFERLVGEAREAAEKGDLGQAAARLRQAEGLWRGRPLADLELEPFAQLEVQRLEELRLVALEDRIEAELALGRHTALCPELATLTCEHPLRERLPGELMLALYRSGRQADALGAYQRARGHLIDELGVEPGPELRALQVAILRHDPSLAPSSGARRGRSATQLVAPDPLGPPTAGQIPSQSVTLIGRDRDADELDASVVVDEVAAGSRPALVGRRSELALLTGMLDVVRDRGGACVVRGEAGIGKSALLEAARVAAIERGWRVLFSAGVESELGLPFAGLHRLLRPILTRVDRLPEPQRAVLLAAFGMDDGEVGDLFLVALAALELLSSEAAVCPLLVVADDLHWLDAASRKVITFVSRRVESDPIVVLAAVREGYDCALGRLGLPELRLGGLKAEAAGQLLDACAPGLPPAVRLRLLEWAAGNPLALKELPTLATSEATAMSTGTAILPVTARLEQAFAHQLRDVPKPTSVVLLLAAADAVSSLADVLAAAKILTRGTMAVAALQPAIDVGLIALVGPRIRFRHPLVRSAIYQAASLQQRQAAHIALSEVCDGQPDRRAWHRAAATFARDDEVAGELEEMAGRARRRGAILQAATALARAAGLTEELPLRIRRLLEAAELAFELGKADMVRSLVKEAVELPLRPNDRARAEWLSEIFADGGHGDEHRALELVEFAVRAGEDGETDLALKLLTGAAMRCWWFGLPTAVRDRVLEAADELPVARSDPRLLWTLAATSPLERAAEVMAGVAAAPRAAVSDPVVAHGLGLAAHAIGDYDSSLPLFATASDALRDQGRLSLLAQISVMRSIGAIFVGAWTVAASAASEAARLAEETDQPIWLGGATCSLSALAGLRGDQAQAEALAAQAKQILDATGSGAVLAWLQIARGLTALTAGRHEAAYTLLVRVFDPSDPSHHLRNQFGAIGLLADAAINCGREQAARALIDRLEAVTRQTTATGVQTGFDYARPLLAADDQAEAAFHAALAAPWSAARPFERARLNFAYGSWLRRQHRMIDAREPLRIAARSFDDLHTPPWSARAREQLRAAGETNKTPRRDAWHKLSPHELQIAELAASGKSNHEIAQRLYLSRRTVARHLQHTLPKLGITSRTQLSSVLPPPTSQPTS
jgi:DNA-binding SARP family transcriptional activator/DNA-binding CsgD family transcriptional regulator